MDTRLSNYTLQLKKYYSDSLNISIKKFEILIQIIIR